jgi:hypothetical protein
MNRGIEDVRLKEVRSITKTVRIDDEDYFSGEGMACSILFRRS